MAGRQRRLTAVVAACLILAGAATIRVLRAQTPPPPISREAAEFFETKVRPLLVERCFACHTKDEQGGLRLDSRERIVAGGDSGPAIVPGDPDHSLLIRAVRREFGAPQMPQKSAKLADAEIATLVQWIAMGAPWPAAGTGSAVGSATPAPAEKPITAEQRAFWSFQPIGATPPPAVRDTAWVKTDIDRFVLARLERDGIAPVRAADKRTLIRRATLDLTGLPPAPEAIEAFEQDASPDAFAKVVDRLLASPQYGEAWGRKWLDVARYGEDDPRSLDPQGRGYAPYPNAYLYRDWVIRAFNEDLPYDSFVRAQIAADLFDEPARTRSLPALGLLGLGPWYYDNGAVEITRADERHDRVDVVTRGFLGLTVACARCHDHKYDPIPTKDYYALAGVFLNTEYHEYPQAPASVVAEYKAQEKRIKDKEKLLGEFNAKEQQQLGEALTLQAAKYMQAAWRVTGEPRDDKASVAGELKLDYELFDRWLNFLGKPPKFYPFLTNWQAMVKRGGTAAEAKKLADEFQALLVEVMFQRKEIEEENDIIRAKALPGTKKKEPANKPNEFVTNDDFCPGCGLELKSMPTERTQLWMDVYRRDLQDAVDPNADPEKFKPGLLAFSGWGLERQLSAERRQYITDLRDDIKAMRKALPPQYAYVHGVHDVEKPVELPQAIRGNPNRPGDPVPRHFLSVLSAAAPRPLTTGSGRLDLADEIVRQPISTRVIVNRIWKGHFGTGLVNTPSNFGVLGERPSHPELLEYLSQWFLDHGRSIKQLHREIMLSAVYQLSSAPAPASAAKDSGNRLYWHWSLRRLAAEEIRDAMLQVSGDLDLKVGGPSSALSPSYKRRTVYGRVSRYRLDQFLQLFDFPAATISAEQRYSTNVPLQRLFFMNSDFTQQQAELIARKVVDEPDNAARVKKAYRLIYGRAPDDAELKAGVAYLAAEPMRTYEERRIAQDTKDAKGTPDTKDGKQSAAEKPDVIAADGMMSGVVAGAGADDKAKLLPVTPLGRYIKVLLSGNEFLFVS
jgi:hypothetical protein